MRTHEEVEEYNRKMNVVYIAKCKKCNGTDPNCKCYEKCEIRKAAYEASVPREFWNMKAKDITHNTKVFNGVVKKYVKNIKTAFKDGYGLFFVGANGEGKTCFMSYVLMKAIRSGYTAYYTTVPQLDYDIKRSFKDQKCEKRLNWFLTSDFVAIDEIGKEHSSNKKNENSSFLNIQLERIFKQRYSECMPTLIASNLSYKNVLNEYGETVNSMLIGKYQTLQMNEGDYRKKSALKMSKKMGY